MGSEKSGDITNAGVIDKSDRESRSGSMASVTITDAVQGLKELGYVQELPRNRGVFHALFMTLSIMAVPYGLGAPIATAIIAGGPAVMVWGFAMVSVFTQALAFSLAEICSVYPTSAGAYYWTFRLAPPRYKVISSWINGWLTMVGVWSISLSVTFGTAQLLVSGIGIYHPDFIFTVWQTYLIFLAVTVFATLFGVFCNGLLPTVDILSGVWTVLGMIVMLICLSTKAAAGRRSASFALGSFDPSASGWTPGWSFFIGLLPPAYTYAAIGMITSMCEEVRNPAREVPVAIACSIPIGVITGLLFLLPIVFTLPDIAMLLSVPGGQPIGVLFTTVMGSNGGGFAMWFIVFMIGVFCAISICCAASRATWSFARDRAIPYSKFFAKVHYSTSIAGVPLNAYILSTAVQLLLGLIYLGSTAAFNAFVGVGVICLGASYAMPVLLSLINRRRFIKDAPYSLGRWGALINYVAVIWVLFEMVLFSMPAVIPVTPISMNYASVVFVGFALISAVWYLINGRKHYAGPPLPDQ